MQDAKDANRVGRHSVGSYIGRARDHELARAGDPTGSPFFRKIDETASRMGDLLVDINGRSRIFGFYMREDVVAIGVRKLRPDEPQRSPASALRSAAARRRAK
jgi:hypothetical protein